jgi:hypothetical protein
VVSRDTPITMSQSFPNAAGLAFEAKLTGMAKDHVARFCYGIVDFQPCPRPGEQSHQQDLVAFERFAPQVLAVEFERVAQDHIRVIVALAQLRKNRHALVITTHRLAVDQAGTHL